MPSCTWLPGVLPEAASESVLESEHGMASLRLVGFKRFPSGLLYFIRSVHFAHSIDRHEHDSQNAYSSTSLTRERIPTACAALYAGPSQAQSVKLPL